MPATRNMNKPEVSCLEKSKQLHCRLECTLVQRNTLPLRKMKFIHANFLSFKIEHMQSKLLYRIWILSQVLMVQGLLQLHTAI